MRLRLAREESGYTMIAVLGAIALVTVLVAAAVAATQGDLRLTQRDLDQKRAYAAAQAGIADYSFHLNNDNGYWAMCDDQTKLPQPNAVNQQNSVARTRQVLGQSDPNLKYAIQLLPATGSSCDKLNPTTSMLETTGTNSGTFRIRSIGYAGNNTKQAVVATYRRATLLDYIYFTQLETSDPVTYGFANPSSALAGAYSQCDKYRRDGRYSQAIPNSGGVYCTEIVFSSSDDIDGPVHTNDELAICGTPSFGRNASDVIEVSSGPQGWTGTGDCGNDSPTFVGPFVTNAPVLTPPPTNDKLRTIAGSYVSTGQTELVLSGTNITAKVNGVSVGTYAIPPDGVIYVANGSCSTGYSPYTVKYPSTSGCGNVLVHGTISGELTIAAENDIIIDGNITRTGNGILGLIANNFVRIKHPVCPSNDTDCSGSGAPGSITSQEGRNDCNGGVNGIGTTSNLRIDAAILAIDHSFIVDHYDCGGGLGTLTINGAIAQKYRGPVGTTGTPGYNKDYNYDDRLRYQEPPSFLNPLEAAWHVQRLTLDFP